MILHPQRSGSGPEHKPIRRSDPVDPGLAQRIQRPHGSRAISLVETQVAFVILGIGLAGICPIVAMHYRQLADLEGNILAPVSQGMPYLISPTTANGQRGRLQAYSYTYNSPGMPRTQVAPGQVHYLVPWNNPWARKLTTRARVVPAPWNSTDPPIALPSTLSVELTGIERMNDSQGAFTGWRAHVKLN